MNPSSFSLDVVLGMSGLAADRMSGGFLIPCPSCEATLNVCHKLGVVFCTSCGHVFDALMLYDRLSGTNYLPTSMQKIVQQNGVCGKVNDKKTEAYQQTFPAFFATLNALQTTSATNLGRGSWVARHGDVLRALDIYPGSAAATTHVLRRNCLLWTDHQCPRTSMKLSTAVEGMAFTKKTGVLVPTWSSCGPSGVWFIADGQATLYTHSNKDVGSPGIAFFPSVVDCDEVLAVSDIQVGLRLQCLHTSLYGRPAPLVVFSAQTQESDWQILADKRRVVVMAGHPDNLGSRAVLSALAALPTAVVHTAATSSQTALNLQSVYAVLRLGTSLPDAVKKVGAPRRPPVLRAIAGVLHSLDGGPALIRRYEEQHGRDVCMTLGLPVSANDNEIRSYAGKKIEDTRNGYAVRSPSHSEPITNFSVDLTRLLRYKVSNRMEYDAVLHIDGQSIKSRLCHQVLTGPPAKLVECLTSTLVDAGVRTAPYISRKWAASLHDVLLLFNRPTADVIVEEAGFDTTRQAFVFPGAVVQLNGELVAGQPVMGSTALSYRGPPDHSTWSQLPIEAQSVLTGICAAVIHALLYSAARTTDTPPTLAYPLSPVGPSVLIDKLLREDLRFLKSLVGRQALQTAMVPADRATIIQLPDVAALALSVAGECVYGVQPPSTMMADGLSACTTLFDGMVIDALSYILARGGQQLAWADVVAAVEEYVYRHLGTGLQATKAGTTIAEELISRYGDVDKAIEAASRAGVSLSAFNFNGTRVGGRGVDDALVARVAHN